MTHVAQLPVAMNPLSTMGSVISQQHLERIEAMLAAEPRAKILAGGKRLTGKSALDEFDFSKGSFFPPTVVTNVSTEGTLWREEVFGPVVVVKQFKVGSLLDVAHPILVN